MCGIQHIQGIAVMIKSTTNLVKDEYFTLIGLDQFLVHQIQYTTRRSNNQVHCKPHTTFHLHTRNSQKRTLSTVTWRRTTGF